MKKILTRVIDVLELKLYHLGLLRQREILPVKEATGAVVYDKNGRPRRGGGRKLRIFSGLISPFKNLAAQSIDEIAGILKPNQVHARIIRADGTIEDLGISTNLRTNTGADWQSDAMGQVLGDKGTSTATSATSLTDTGKAWTVNQWVGHWVTAGNVAGRVVSNTATVLTVDAWVDVASATYATGTTPGATTAYTVLPGRASACFVGITTDSAAPAATNTALASEETTQGLGRKLAVYAHTNGTTTYTQTLTFTYTGSTSKTIQKAGCFTNLANGVMVFETLLNAPATLATSGDALQITWTVSI
jgi:hypothetical protein